MSSDRPLANLPSNRTPREQRAVPVAEGMLEELGQAIARAAERAQRTRYSVLASASQRIGDIDPLHVLASADRAAKVDANLSALLTSARMFWAHPREQFAMAGLGAATTISPSGADRFRQADAAWRALLDNAVEIGVDTSGTVLMGGFSFEPDGPRSAAWTGFPSTLLMVPALRVTRDASGTSATVAVLVAPDGTLSVSLQTIGRLIDVALSSAPNDAPPSDGALSDSGAIAYSDERPAAEWRSLVNRAVSSIADGALQKVVLARAVLGVAPDDVDIHALLEHLRELHRDSYVFACWRGDRVFLGASPERLVRLAGRVVDATSLAGSARRGASASEDATLAAELMRSEKDRAEHAMVRTALVDALGTLCDNVRSGDEPSLLTLPHVHHLHTAVHATLRDDRSLLELVGALHPTPAVGGTPRSAALAFIRSHEQLDRGWYAAPIGWIGRDAGELAVALRSAVIEGRRATLFAGCGIVAGSDAERELEESRVKLRPMQMALASTISPALEPHA